MISLNYFTFHLRLDNLLYQYYREKMMEIKLSKYDVWNFFPLRLSPI